MLRNATVCYTCYAQKPMHENRLIELKERLLETRAKLLDFVAEGDVIEPGWLSMIAGVQAALQAVEEAMEEAVKT